MLSIKGIDDQDYFKILCADCNVETRNEYQGVDQFRSACPKCNQTGIWKLTSINWIGLPKNPI